MVEHVATLLRGVAGVEKAALVFFDGHAEIEAAGQAIRQQPARLQVQYVELLLILAAPPDAISQQLAIPRDAPNKDRRGFVLTDIGGIAQHFVFARRSCAHADGRAVLIRQSAAEEITSVPLD